MAQHGKVNHMNIDIKECWKDENFLSQNLTLNDIVDLLDYIAPWLESMELKFSWDHSVNDMRLSYFVNSAVGQMYEVVNDGYKEEYELYPKQRDFESLWNIISEYSTDDSIGKNDKIWELVRDKILEISKEVLN